LSSQLGRVRALPSRRQHSQFHRINVTKFRHAANLSARIANRESSSTDRVTRLRITLDCWLAETNGDSDLTTLHPTTWVAPSEFARYPFSTTGRQFAETLRRELRQPNLFRSSRHT
jgi:hypothetical protein